MLYTVPLRRSLVVESKLPYPEGTACANILKVASSEVDENGVILNAKKKKNTSTNASNILFGSLIAALTTIGQDALAIFSTLTSYVTAFRGYLFSISAQFSPSLIAAGYLVGRRGTINFLLGYIIALSVIGYISVTDPVIIQEIDANNLYFSLIMKIWSEKLRYVGVGFMAAASLWTIIKLFKPLVNGIKSSYEALRQYKEGKIIKRTSRDIPVTYILFLSIFLLLPVFLLFNHFMVQTGIESLPLLILLVLLAYVIGFIISTASGYMAGLVGSSYTPISGIIIVATLTLTAAVIAFAKCYDLDIGRKGSKGFIALILLSLSFILSVGLLANDNLQDLKTGQLVNATPYKQQATLIIGAIVGSAIIGIVIQVLYNAYGFVGAMPIEGMDPSLALAAPQANLINSIIKGMFTGNLDWPMINIGFVLAVLAMISDYLLKGKGPLQPLAIAIAIYLPPPYTVSIMLGTLIEYLVNRKAKKSNNKDAHNRGTLFVSGIIVGESLIGVIFAAYLTYNAGDNGLALKMGSNVKETLGILAFLSILFFTWKRALHKAK